MTNSNRRLWDSKHGMEGENKEENAEIVYRSLHMVQPPPPPPPQNEQKCQESPVEKTAGVTHMQSEHKIDVSQPPPKYQIPKWKLQPPVNPPLPCYTMPSKYCVPPPPMAAPPNIVPKELECCKSGQQDIIEREIKKQLDDCKAKFFLESENYKRLDITIKTTKNIMKQCNFLSGSHNNEIFLGQISGNTMGSSQSQNPSNSSMSSFNNPQTSNFRHMPNLSQDQTVYNHYSLRNQPQNHEDFVTQRDMSTTDQFQQSVVSNRPNMSIGHTHAMSNIMCSQSQPTSNMHPPPMTQCDQTMRVAQLPHLGTTRIVSGNFGQVNMQPMQQPFVQQNSGQINASQAQAYQFNTILSNEIQQPQSQSRNILDNIRQGLNDE